MSQYPKCEHNIDPSTYFEEVYARISEECLPREYLTEGRMNGNRAIERQPNQGDKSHTSTANQILISQMKNKPKIELLQRIVAKYEHEVDMLRKRLERLEKEVKLALQAQEPKEKLP